MKIVYSTYIKYEFFNLAIELTILYFHFLQLFNTYQKYRIFFCT